MITWWDWKSALNPHLAVVPNKRNVSISINKQISTMLIIIIDVITHSIFNIWPMWSLENSFENDMRFERPSDHFIKYSLFIWGSRVLSHAIIYAYAYRIRSAQCINNIIIKIFHNTRSIFSSNQSADCWLMTFTLLSLIARVKWIWMYLVFKFAVESWNGLFLMITFLINGDSFAFCWPTVKKRSINRFTDFD